MRRILLLVIPVFLIAFTSQAQFYFLHAEYRNDWYAGTYPLNPNFAAIGYDQVTVQAQSANDQFVLERNFNNDKWFASGINLNSIYTATYGNIGSPDSYLSSAVTTGKFYTHVVEYNPASGGLSNSRAIVMETSNAPVNISAVTPYGRVCGLNNAFTVKVDLSAAKSAEEVVYVRYCQGNNFSGGATGVVKVNFQTATSSSGYAYIPMNGAGLPTIANGDAIYYYVLSSTKTNLSSATSNSDINLYTLRVNTNGAIGTNYNFVVNTSYYSALPLAGTYNVNSSTAPDLTDGNYSFSSLATAIAVLDSNGVSANTIFNIPSGFTETAPAGGYQIVYKSSNSGCGLNAVPLANLSNASQTVSFKANGSGAKPLLTAYSPQSSGNILDAVVKIIGADYISFDSIEVQENAANSSSVTATNNMTEFGFALFYATTTNGAQNNTIRNCSISLDRTYANTFGIYSNTRHTSTNGTVAADNTSVAGSNSNNKFYGNSISDVNTGIMIVGSAFAANMDAGNDIGGSSASTGNTVTNWGGLAPNASMVSVPAYVAGIYCNHQTSVNVRYNTLNTGATGTTVSLKGIAVNFSAGPASGSFVNTVANNIITTNTNSAGGTSLYIIDAQGGGSNSDLIISNNRIINCSLVPASSGPTARGINIAGSGNAYNNLTISNNVFSGNTTSQSAGSWTAILNQASTQNLSITGNRAGGITFNSSVPSNINMILNTGTAFNTINFSNDTIADIIFNVAVSGGLSLISNTAASSVSTASLDINQNVIQDIHLNSGASASFTFINNTTAALAERINANKFNGLSINTSGSISFISNSSSLFAGGSKEVNGNIVSGGFSKTGSGAVVSFYVDAGSSAAGTTAVNNNNDFSNISLTGSTTLSGWTNDDAGTTKNISGNNFSNISCGGSVQIIEVANAVSNVHTNTISNVSSGISGISAIKVNTAGDHNIYRNTISGVSSSGTSAIATAVQVAGAGTTQVYGNNIQQITGTQISSSAYGIYVNGGTEIDLYNNFISRITTPGANGGNAVNGIHIAGGTDVNLYYNSILLTATSAVAGFGSSAVYAVTGVNVDMRNNILINRSVPTAGGYAVAYRRSSNALGTYSLNADNNLLYAGSPAANHLLYTDGTTNIQTLVAYQAAMAPREAAAISSDLSFVDAANGDLHLLLPDDGCIVGDKGQPVTAPIAVTDDYDADARSNTKPTIGADEASLQYIYSNPVGNCSSTPVVNAVNCGGPLSGNSWVYFVDPLTRKIVAAINPNGSNLGTVNVTMYNLDGSFSALQTYTDHSGFNWNYLNKIWNITSTGTITPGNEPTVRFYYTAAEMFNMRSAAAVGCSPCDAYTDKDLVLLQATAVAEDCNANNNASSPQYNVYWYKDPSNYTLEQYHIKRHGFDISLPLYGNAINYYGDISSGVGSVISTANTEFDGRYFQATVPSFSEFRLFLSPERILPVKWNTISGQLVNDHGLISWSTSEEKNTALFDIERSNDAVNFIKIGTVAAAGNSNRLQTYSFADHGIRPGRNYYRIKVTDLSGRIDYSSVVLINANIKGLVAEIFPNPVHDDLKAMISIQEMSTAQVQVLSVTGKVVITKTVQLNSGANNITIDTHALPAGTYFLKLTTDKTPQETIPFVKY